MSAYTQVAKQSFMLSIAYNSVSFVWMAIAILELLIPLAIWYSATPINGSFGSFSREQLLAYYGLMAIIGNLTFWWLHFQISDLVRYGDLSNILVKPVSVLRYLIAHQLGDKVFSLIIRLPLFIALIYFFGKYFPSNILSYLPLVTLSVLLGGAIYLLINILFGLLSFWLTDLGGFIGLYFFTAYILSGELAPIAFYPHWFQYLAYYLPYRYILSFPIEIILQKLSGTEMVIGFITQLLWLGLLYLGVRIFWKKSLIRYQAYGK